MQLLTQDKIDSVRIKSPEGIRAAAEALHRISLDYGLRAAPAHDIADKRTPVDAEGKMLATEVFGWGDDERVWWRNSRIALDSPLTTACRFESQPFWANAEGFRTRDPNGSLASLDIGNFEHRAMTRAAIGVPVHLPFGQIGAVSFNPLDRDRTDLSEDFERCSDALGLYARTFIATYVQVMGSTQALPPGSRKACRNAISCAASSGGSRSGGIRKGSTASTRCSIWSNGTLRTRYSLGGTLEKSCSRKAGTMRGLT